MSNTPDLNEVLEGISYGIDFFESPFLKERIVSKSKIETENIEKLIKYSSFEDSSEFLKQLKRVKEIDKKEVQDLILMLDVYAGTVNDIILDFEEDNVLASVGDKIFYTSILKDKEETSKSLEILRESYYTLSDITDFRLQTLEEIKKLEKEDDLYKERLERDILNITENNSGDIYGEKWNKELEININEAARDRVSLNIAERKKQRYIDLEVKTKRMEFLL